MLVRPMEDKNGNVIANKIAIPVQTSHLSSEISDGTSDRALDDDEMTFGWGKIRPKCLKFLNCPVGCLLVFGVYNMLLGIAAWGLPSVVLPSIERRFSFSSKELGVIFASNDVTALLFVVFISYYGDYANKIKWIAAGATTTGVGIILFALPHFMIGRYHPGNGHSDDICSHRNSTLAQCAEPNSGGDWYYLTVFLLAMLIMGAGGAPYFCLFNAYLDENVEPKSFPVYLGIFSVIQFIAPATGFLLGGKFLSIYVDIKQPADFKLTPKDPEWIGAWWLGFLIFGVAILFCSFLMIGFPREMPGAREKRLRHIREGNIQASNDVKHPSLRKMPNELKELLKNFTFLFNVLGFTCLTFYAGPIAVFLTKIVRIKFGLDAVEAGYFVATAVILGSVLGIITGTIIVRMFSLKTTCKKAAAACVIAHLLVIGGSFVFVIPACENTNMAAVSVWHSNATGLLMSRCNTTCYCSRKTFSPVCGSDNVTYFDACHAGCTAKLPDKTFTNCSCISGDRTAKSGYCDRQCKNVVIFIVIIVLTSSIRFSTGVPSRTVVLRCVPDNKRAFASGVWYVTFKTLGLLPSPVIFGHIMDESCTLWQNICGNRGRCFHYDVTSLSNSIAYFGFSFSVLTTFFYFLSWYYCKSGKQCVCIENQGTDEPRETNL